MTLLVIDYNRVHIYRNEFTLKWTIRYKSIVVTRESFDDAWKYYNFLNQRRKELSANADQWARI